MYGYSIGTVAYWAVETIGLGVMAVLLILTFWGKWRFSALVYPVGQLLIRTSILFLQPDEYGYELTIDKAALMIGLCVFSALMLRSSDWGYVTAVASLGMIFLTLPEGLYGIGTFFTFGYEMTFLGLQVIFSALLYLSLIAVGMLFARGKMKSKKTEFGV